MLVALGAGLVPADAPARRVKHAKHHRAHHRSHKRAPKRRAGRKPSVAAPAAPRHDGLGLDDTAFWDGPTIHSGNVQDPSLCGTAGPCPTFPLKVLAKGARLRVALDTPARTNSFEIDLIDPSGKVAATAASSNQFDVEAYVKDPAPGTWTVRVLPQGVEDGSFRMRAKLESTIPQPPAGHVALLPDLKAVPPYEFTFIAPANPANGLYPPDTVNPPLDILGQHPLSCTVDEMAPTDVQGGAATKCLRFTAGPIDDGPGPFDMRFKYAQDMVDGTIASPIAHGPMSQAVHYSDGKIVLRPAGTYSFHVMHFHFHDDNVLAYNLYKVSAGDQLVQAGIGTKSGFCPANQLIGNWAAFDNQAPDPFLGSGDTGTGNCQGPTDGVLGLSPGWGDIYRWQRPGQYVEFGDNGDGTYVVRVTIDPENHVLETNESDNSSYALIKVVGDSVQLIERGQGLSPFDPDKVVFRGAGPAAQ